jgi:hypothetical protein
MKPAENAAKEILANLEATYQPSHHYVTVQAKAFSHLDLRFYDQAARALGAKGFRTVADVEDTTITSAPNNVLMPVLIRALLSRDGTVMAALYHPRLKSLLLRVLFWILRRSPGKVADMETECSDGSFVATTNAMGAAAMELPALISGEFLPNDTPVLEVLARHTARVAAHLAARPGVSARVITSHAELIASQNRMNAIKSAHRGEIGMITREELDQLAVVGGKAMADEVHQEVREQQLRRAS